MYKNYSKPLIRLFACPLTFPSPRHASSESWLGTASTAQGAGTLHSDTRYNNVFCFLPSSFPTKSNNSISSCDLYGALCSDIHRATYPNPSISVSSELTIVYVNLGIGFLICLIGLLPAVDFICHFFVQTCNIARL